MLHSALGTVQYSPEHTMTDSLSTSRLLIRPLELRDSAAVYAYRSDPEVIRYQMWQPESESDVRSFVREQLGTTPGMPGMWFQFAIVRKRDGVLMGDCGVHVPLEYADAAELGMTLALPWQRQGYAAEALGALIEYCFSSLHLHAVLARTEKRNLRSITLIRRMNFYPARPEHYGMEPTEDELFFAMEKRDWERQDGG